MTPPSLAYAVRLLARQPYHSIALKQKLIEKGATAEQADSTLEQLRRMKYLDDRAYLGNFFRDQLERKAQSARLVRQKLLRRGIPLAEIEAFFDSAVGEKWLHTEVDRARAAATRKFAALGALDAGKTDPNAFKNQMAAKQKVARFLAARGFSGEIIGKVLRETF